MGVEPGKPFVSVIIPTFNRRHIIDRALNSALKWAEQDGTCEILVVDDGSTDGTLAHLRINYAAKLKNGGLSLLRTPTNLGAAGAKNHGAAAARGRWLLFLDSDDALLPESKGGVLAALTTGDDATVHFFRCRDHKSGALIGAPLAHPRKVDTREYLAAWKWAECLPVVRRDLFERFPYEAALRGHEGIAYARLFKHVGSGRVHPLVAREYDDGGADRLSSRTALWRRGRLLAQGYAMTLREFYAELSLRERLKLSARIVYYRGAALFVAVSDAISRG